MPAVSGVVTFAVTWIEIGRRINKWESQYVVTFAVTWIEISNHLTAFHTFYSRHLRGDVD